LRNQKEQSRIQNCEAQATLGTQDTGRRQTKVITQKTKQNCAKRTPTKTEMGPGVRGW
jgi:hypothetical protein